MSVRNNSPEYIESGVSGPKPTDWFGTNAIDGDAGDFVQVGPGSSHIKRDLTNNLANLPVYKLKADKHDNDYGGIQLIRETVTRAMFTDGGSAAGTYDLKTQIPQGALVIAAWVQDLTGFTGNTSATLTIGDGSDVDRYNTGTPSVFTTANALAMGVPSGALVHIAAVTPRLTVTGNSDFTAITAGVLTVSILYAR